MEGGGSRYSFRNHEENVKWNGYYIFLVLYAVLNTRTYKNLPLKGNICRTTAVDVKKIKMRERTFWHNSSRAIVLASPQVWFFDV